MAEEILTHTHEVVDADPHFVIDPKTKKITPGSDHLTLAQHSKNSERLTFRIPDKTVEGHDMSQCNDVRIHFENIDQGTGKRALGIYKITDLAVSSDSVTLSWLVDEDATRYAGALIFSIHFGCLAEDGSVVYNFPTLTFSGLTVGETVWNSQTIEEQYPDVIQDFENRIRALETGANVSVQAGATAEQAAQIQANAEAIADIQDPVVSGNTHVDGSTYTLTMPRESGAVDTVVLEFDANGYISKVTENGREILWTTTGV